MQTPFVKMQPYTRPNTAEQTSCHKILVHSGLSRIYAYGGEQCSVKIAVRKKQDSSKT